MTPEIATLICERIIESLGSDIVSFAEMRQTITDVACEQVNFNDALKILLPRLLESYAEIGNAFSTSKNYVEFVGWNGDIPRKIDRAIDCVSNSAQEADFAIWLALKRNVDRYEP